MATTNFKEAGIKFQVIGEADFARTIDFLFSHYFPDEPISRSLAFTYSWFWSFIITDAMKKGCSIMATNSAGEIVGVRIAEIIRRDSWKDWLGEKIFMRILPVIFKLTPNCLLSQSFVHFPVLVLVMERLGYSKWRIFKMADRKTMLASLMLCTSRTSGIRGLGTELLKSSEKLGQEKGCDYAASNASGKYSQACFRRQGYSELNTLVYANFKDDQGELYLKDTREHPTCILFTKDLK